MRILFGGSFDPFHLGHLSIIKGVIEKFNPYKFILVPANASMSKIKYIFPPELRLDFIIKSMSDLPTDIKSCIEISDYELRQGKPVYTFETITELQPDTLLVGGDHDYTKWKSYIEIIEPAIKQFLIYPRNNNPENPRSVKEVILDLPPFRISSMEIIEKMYKGESINGLVHHSIIGEIEQFKLDGNLPDKIFKWNSRC